MWNYLEVEKAQGNPSTEKFYSKPKNLLIILVSVAVATALIVGISIGLSNSSTATQILSETPSQQLLPGSADAIAHAINAFGIELFTILTEPDIQTPPDTAFVSPWGIAHALAMLYEGTGEGTETRRQIEDYLFRVNADKNPKAKETAPPVDLRASVQALSLAITTTTSDSEGNANFTVDDANSVWISPDFKIQFSYITALEEYYNAKAAPLTSASVVNQWVSEKTHDKIPEIIDDQTAQQSALFLANALYFKSPWKIQTPFLVSKATFNRIDTQMMLSTFLFLKHDEGNDVAVAMFAPPDVNGPPCIVVKLPYANKFSALLAMPQGDFGPEPVKGRLSLKHGEDYGMALRQCHLGLLNSVVTGNATVWRYVGDPLVGSTLKIVFPRFESHFSTSLHLVLQEMGMRAMFAPGDFTQISKNTELAVSDVIHKVFLKVDEHGTEAAAATGIPMVTSAPVHRPSKFMMVNFNRPFAFSIVHDDTKVVLFSGQVHKPEEWVE